MFLFPKSFSITTRLGREAISYSRMIPLHDDAGARFFESAAVAALSTAAWLGDWLECLDWIHCLLNDGWNHCFWEWLSD
jgi:hypothetical protein